MESNGVLLEELKYSLNENLLRKWYPLVIDTKYGGYFTNVSHDWTLPPEQEKMIVTQARHVWTLSKVAEFLGESAKYPNMAQHGFAFLRDVMWDREFGGFYQIRSRNGGCSDMKGWHDEKRTYGNAFAVYALAALYGLTGEMEVLRLAREAFDWIEEHAFDPEQKGYFQFLTREGETFFKESAYKSAAADANEVGYKDQNSSIHLLEAYTELYKFWKNRKVKRQLAALLSIIRDTMVTQKGYLQLFFHPDWSPVSFTECPQPAWEENFGLDHVSFGHDYETAYLMLEASHTLGLESDGKTLRVAKRMLDHALVNGWDNELGGFYDAGYYFRDRGGCTIVRSTKNWWAQAEGLNALLLFSRIFPEADYWTYFLRQWEYVKKYILDWERGDWFEGGLDKEPEFATGPKSHIWKCTYHTGRALMNSIALLTDEAKAEPGVLARKNELEELINHWTAVKEGKC